MVSIRKILGYAMISTPFVLVTVAIVIDMGWLAAVIIWAMVLVLLVILAGGFRLIEGED